MSKKRSHIDIDPDYEDVSDQQNKRQRVLEEGAKEATKQKIERIIRKQFGQEIENKEAEIMTISEKLERSRTVLDRLRACIVASYYGNASQQKCSQSKPSQQAPMIHPTVKKHLGKAPKGMSQSEKLTSQPGTIKQEPGSDSTKVKVISDHGPEKIGSMALDNSIKGLAEAPVPSINAVAMTTKTQCDQSETRAGRYKVKKRIIVGNVSKTIPADRRDENDQATHKWMVYVRGPKESPRIDHFVKKVWFFLHPSYRPNDLVEVSEHPFHLTRRGWGEFPVRVQLHFKDLRNKRLDIIHNLKLDRTYTSLQTLGSETVVDVELEKDISEVKKKKTKVSMATGETTITNSTVVAIKQEPQDYNENLNNNSTVGTLRHPVTVKMEPGTQACVNNSLSDLKMIRNIKLEPMDHDYGFSAHMKNISSASNLQKKDNKNAANFVIPGGNNNVRLVFSGIGTAGSPNLASALSSVPMVSSQIPPGKSSKNQQVSPQSQKPGQTLLQVGNSLTLQGIGSLSNSGLLIPNQLGSKQNSVPIILGSSPTKVSGKQSVMQPGSILLSSLPSKTPVSGNQVMLQTGSIPSSAVPVTQTVIPGNQTNNPGLIFLKCTDNQGKTYLIPQQVGPSVQTSKSIVSPIKGNNPALNQTVLFSGATLNQSSTNNKLSNNLSGSQLKTSTSPSVVNLSQLTAVGLQPKQSPVQLAGPLIFIKPEEVSKSGPQSKSLILSQPNSNLDAKPVQNNQVLRLVTPQKSQTGTIANSIEGKNLVTQSNMRGQLKVTSQGLITVQSSDKTLDKNVVVKKEPVDGTHLKINGNIKTSVAKQPVIILPNNKVSVSMPNKSTSLLTPTVKMSASNTSSNVVIVNASKDLSTQKSEARSDPNSVSNQITINAIPDVTAGQDSSKPKTNMLLLQSKTSGSDKPNHLVIVPVSCANNTVTRPTVSIATMSSLSSGTSLVVSKSLTTLCSTSSVSEPKISTTSMSDKNKTMYIVVDSHSKKERSSEVTEGQRSMTSLINKAAVPVCSVTSSSANAGKSVKIISAQSLLSSSTPSLSSLSSSSSSSLLTSSVSSGPTLHASSSSSSNFSMSDTIPVTISTSSQKQTRVLVVKADNQVPDPQKQLKSGDKKIISLVKKKKAQKVPEQIIKPLNISDYSDMLSLVRVAVQRHPVVSPDAGKHLHPYCAVSKETWLNWNIGKRRSSEWQRASTVRKFILSYLDDSESFKGEQIWSVKQILTWCRLHAYSPHYLEKPLHPTGINLQAESSLTTDKNLRFKSLSGYSHLIQEVVSSQKSSPFDTEDGSEDYIDIISTEPAKVKVKTEVVDITMETGVEHLPMSDSAAFVNDTAKKIGIKFAPTEIEPGYHGSLSQDYIFSAMESFMGDILRETFAHQVNMGRYPDALGVADVYRALSNQPITDFVTNQHMGVEENRGVPTAYR